MTTEPTKPIEPSNDCPICRATGDAAPWRTFWNVSHQSPARRIAQETKQLVTAVASTEDVDRCVNTVLEAYGIGLGCVNAEEAADIIHEGLEHGTENPFFPVPLSLSLWPFASALETFLRAAATRRGDLETIENNAFFAASANDARPDDWTRVDTITVAWERSALSDLGIDTDEAIRTACDRAKASLAAAYPQASIRVFPCDDKYGRTIVSGATLDGPFVFDNCNDDVPLLSVVTEIANG